MKILCNAMHIMQRHYKTKVILTMSDALFQSINQIQVLDLDRNSNSKLSRSNSNNNSNKANKTVVRLTTVHNGQNTTGALEK